MFDVRGPEEGRNLPRSSRAESLNPGCGNVTLKPTPRVDFSPTTQQNEVVYFYSASRPARRGTCAEHQRQSIISCLGRIGREGEIF